MTAREDVDALRARNAAAADLAALCSVTVLVEAPLLRLLRLLLPDADVSAETDLWSSPLPASASVNGLALRPDVAAELSAQLRLPRWDGTRERALALIDTAHAGASWSMRLAEQLSQVALADDPTARTRELVLAALAQLTERAVTPRERTGVARWLLSALARLPRDALADDAAQAAACAANLQLGGRLPAGTDSVVEDRWLPYLLAANTETVDVPVQFETGRLDVNRAADTVLALPRTDPLVLDLDWTDAAGPQSHRLRFAAGEPAAVTIGSDTVEVRTLAGDGVRLSDPARPGGDGGFDFSAQWARYTECAGRDSDLAQSEDDLTRSGVLLIIGPPGCGKTTLACELVRRQARAGAVVVSHFFGVVPSWDDLDLVRDSLAAQIAGAGDAADVVVVVLLDDLPLSADEADFDPIFAVVGSDARIVVTRPEPGGAGAGERVPLRTLDAGVGAERVCAAMINASEPPPPLAPQDFDILVLLADANPRRLRMILDWLALQPGPLRLADIPPSLTTGFPAALASLGDDLRGLDRLADVAVAGPGFTVADLARIASLETTDGLADFLAAASAARLVHLDGPAQMSGCWLPNPVRPAAGLADALDGVYAGNNPLGTAHFRHAAAASYALVPGGRPTPYQVGNGVAHLVAAQHAGQDIASVQSFWASARFVHLRALQDGVAAAVADLDSLAGWPDVAPVAEAARFVASAFGSAPPEHFADLVVNELRRRGMSEGEIGPIADPQWPAPLAVRWAAPVPADPPAEQLDVTLAGAGAWLAGGFVHFADGRPPVPTPVGVAPTMLAAGEGFLAVTGAADPNGAATRLVVRTTSALTSRLVVSEPLDLPHPSGSPVQALGFGAAGLLVAGRDNGTVDLVSAHGSRSVQLTKGPYPIRAVHVREDGRTVVTVDDTGATAVLDAATSGASEVPEPPTLTSTRSDVTAVAIDPDQLGTAVATRDGLLRVTGGVREGRLPLPSGSVANVLAFAPSGQTLAAGTGSSVLVLDTRTMTRLRTFEHPSEVRSLAISADGLLAAGMVEGGVHVRGIDDGLLRTVIAAGGVIGAVQFSPDGTVLARDDGAGLTLHAVPDGTLLTTVEVPGAVTTLAFSPDGTQLATGGADGVVRVFGISRVIDADSADWDLTAPATSLDVIDGLVAVGCQDGIVLCADSTRLDTSWRLVGHGAAITAVAAGPGSTVATASEDGTVRLWPRRADQVSSVLRHRAPVQRVCSTGRHLVSADDGGTVRWWSGDRALTPVFAHGGTVVALLPFLDGSVVSCAADGSIVASRVSSDGVVQTDEWSPPASAIRFVVRTGEFVVTWHDDGTLRWWASGNQYGAQSVQGTVRAVMPDALPGSVRVVHDAGTVVVGPPTSAGDDDLAPLRCLGVHPNGTVATGAPSGLWTRESLHDAWTLVETATPRALAIFEGDLLFVRPDGSAGWPVSAPFEAPIELLAASAAANAVVVDARLHLGSTTPDTEIDIGLRRGERASALAIATTEVRLALGTDRGRVIEFDAAGRPTREIDLGPAPIGTIAQYFDGFTIGTQDGAVFIWRPDTAPVLLGRHADQVEGVTTVAGRVLSAGADGTLRLWDAVHGGELGLIGHTGGFTAVAAVPSEPGRAYARTADNLFWMIDTVGFEYGPLAPDLLRVQLLRGDDHPPTTGDVHITLGITAAVPIEIRRITVATGGQPARRVIISVGQASEFAEPVDADGGLAVPVRCPADETVPVRLSLASDMDQQLTIGIWIATRTRAGELPFEIKLPPDAGTSSMPFTVTYRGQEEPDHAHTEAQSGRSEEPRRAAGKARSR